MKKKYPLGKLWGLEWGFYGSAVLGTLLLWVVLSLGARWALDVGMGTAVLVGLLAVLLHWFGETGHQLGHAWVARRVGYPMQGIYFWWVLQAARYPKDEPPLPARTHIQRALGGPPVSLLLSILGGLIALLLRSTGGIPYTLALFFCLENLFVFCLGAFLPLGFTDGSTLLYWWPKRNEKQ